MKATKKVKRVMPWEKKPAADTKADDTKEPKKKMKKGRK